jgi:hypothetical protein
MWRDLALGFRGPPNIKNIGKGQTFWQAAQAASLKLPQTFADCHSGRKWLAKNTPRLVGAPRERTNAREFFFGILGPVSAAQCSYNPDNLPSKLQSTLD